MSIINQIRDNLQFRIRTAREMLMGTSNAQEAQPLERRREIMRRRRDLVVGSYHEDDMEHSADHMDHSSSRQASDRAGPEIRRSSGQINEDDSEDTVSEVATRSSRNPSMSDVNRGTAERAMDRGFQR